MQGGGAAHIEQPPSLGPVPDLTLGELLPCPDELIVARPADRPQHTISVAAGLPDCHEISIAQWIKEEARL